MQHPSGAGDVLQALSREQMKGKAMTSRPIDCTNPPCSRSVAFTGLIDSINTCNGTMHMYLVHTPSMLGSDNGLCKAFHAVFN